MSYDEGLEHRIMELLSETPDLVVKKMFGGVCFLLHGNMACGIIRDDLIVRVGMDGYAAFLKLPNVQVFDLTGRTMKGWVMVSPEGFEDDEDLLKWTQRGVRYALSLPPK